MKIAGGIVLLLIAAGIIGFLIFSEKNTEEIVVEETENAERVLGSRELMERAIEIVKEKKPTPTQSSRFYAVVATDYYENMDDDKEYTNESLLAMYDEIIANDSQEIKNRPTGDAYWVSSVAPFSPNAADAERFIIEDDYTYAPPPPPEFGSEEHQRATAEVKMAAENRTAEQAAAINFWGGVPGTEAPSGIWQNRLWSESQKYNLSDEEYAYAQMILAQSLADSFMECWKVKYQYWTKRPDMVDPTIVTAMPNPPFPSYLSGHSTISFTAATVLAQMFPQDAQTYLADAEEAKNSRLWAGIHFPHDNEEGKKSGIEIGNYIIQKIGLEAIR